MAAIEITKENYEAEVLTGTVRFLGILVWTMPDGITGN